MFANRLKNYFSLSALLLGAGMAFSQELPPRVAPEFVPSPTAKAGQLIDVNVTPYPASNYTVEQLVKNVLITGTNNCGNQTVSNVVVYPNAAVTNTNRPWGYFNKGTAQFPFAEGIVLSTGYAKSAGNVNVSNNDNLSTTFGNNSGDQDLATAIGVNNASLRDPVYIEFDFVPSSTQMKFNYIFASEEYTGSFPCSYTDGFALLLKKVGDPTYTNLAVLPGGGGPVSVTNIRPYISPTCPAVNATYFAGYNTANVGTNFNGRTVPLTAMATVIPGETYHIKMVLADYSDNSYDSAVFLEAGSFDIGVQIQTPAGVTLPSNIDVCDNAPQVMVASVQATGATYQWFLGTNPIPGATNASYTPTQAGTYTVEVTIPGNTCPGTATITVNLLTSPVVQNTSLTECYTAGNGTFNLTTAQSLISTTPGVTYSYYVNLTDAQAGNTNTIATPTAFSSAGQTVYVLVKNGICSKIAELQLIIAPQLGVNIAVPQNITCSVPEITLDASASIYPAGSTFTWTTPDGNILSGDNTLTPLVNEGGTYTLTISNTYQPNNKMCSNSASIIVVKDVTPPVISVTATQMTICEGDSVMLTASGAVTYSWTNLPGTGDTQTVSPTSATTYTVTGTGANGCLATAPATITIDVVPAIVSTLTGGQICPGDQIVLDAGSGPNYTYLWNTGETTQTITTGVSGTYTVTIDNGVCTRQFSTDVIQAQIPQIINADFQNNTLTLTVSNPSNGNLEYSIDGGMTWQSSNIFYNVSNNVTLDMRVRVKFTSCESNMSYFTFYMQNHITPNGDGINDVIDLSGLSIYNNFGGSVFDRYGKIIFKADKTNTIWDGTFQGRKLPTATYWYQLHWEDPANKSNVQKNGWILLKNRE